MGSPRLIHITAAETNARSIRSGCSPIAPVARVGPVRAIAFAYESNKSAVINRCRPGFAGPPPAGPHANSISLLRASLAEAPGKWTAAQILVHLAQVSRHLLQFADIARP
jgi:hypothetical protein